MKPYFLIPEEPLGSYEDYLEAAGGDAVAAARGRDPEDVVAALRISGLRGRGGAGFPTGVKWASLLENPCELKHVVCNGAEGEPGTFKDRFLFRKNPYPVLEGLLVAAHVLGVREVHLALKASFRRELARLRAAIEELTAHGVTGDVDFVLVEGPDEYLFGEEKALLNVIDGAGPLPREPHYPPYEWGLDPTRASPNPALVNNAETFAHVPGIVLHGPDGFRQLGTANTPGTVIYTVSGDVARPGVYELEAGIPLRTLFEEVAGGPRPGRRFVAALSGVASAAIPAAKFDRPADFDSLKMIGAGLGSAGFMVIDDATSIPRVAQSVARFLAVESCNQCTSCMHGLRAASRALDRLFDPTARQDSDLRRAVDSARAAPHQNRCYLPVQGSVVIPSLVEGFGDDFRALLDGAREEGEAYPIPKILDYDEEAHRFTVDGRQAFKQFDWTYAPEAGDGEGAPWEPSRPAAESEGSVSVPLPLGLARTLERVAGESGEDLDEVVERALGEWLRSRPGTGA